MKNRFRIFLILGLFALTSVWCIKASHSMIPFAFWNSKTSNLVWDFTTTSSLPSLLTFSRASTATYFDSTGTLRKASAHTPRFDHDPSSNATQGLLLEAEATNLNICSENIDLSSCWNTEGGTPMTVALDVATAPDGTMTADRLTAAGNSWTYADLPTTTANIPYVFSIYLKSPGSNGVVSLRTQEAAGSYTQLSSANASVTTSWKRFYVTVTKTNTNPVRFLITMGNGQLTQVLAWGAQVEQGTIPSSYIPTTMSSATRAAETLSFNSVSWFNNSAGTLFAEYVNLRNENDSAYTIFSLSESNAAGTFTDDSIELSDNNTTVTSGVRVGGTAQFNPGGSLNAVGAVNRQAMTYKSNAFTSSINRGAVSTDTGGSLPAPVYGYIGSQPGGTMRNRYLRKIQYHNTALSDAALQGL